MNDPSQVPFPYKRPVIQVNQVSRKMKLKEGIKRPIEKYGWMSEGKLKPIEKGLPLIFGSKVSHAFEDIEISHKRFTNFVEQYKKFKTGDEFDDSICNDENEEKQEEQEEEEDEIEISYNPFKFLTDKIAAENETTEDEQDHQTGISTTTSTHKKDYNASIIKSISPIKFSSVKPSHEIKKPLYMSPFYRPQIETKSKFKTKSTVPLLQQQLKRVFKPDSAPFENVDKSEDFPTTMLLPMVDETTQNKRCQSELSILRKKKRIINPKNDKKSTKKAEPNSKNMSFPDDSSSTLLITEMKPDMYSKDTFIDSDDQNNETKDNNDSTNNKNKYDDLKDVPSTLLDPTKEDIFWTKNKTPYTREDINHIFSWQMQNDAIMTMIEEKRQKKLDDRQKALMTTFESKEAFAHAVDLVDKECERIVKLGPGKSERNKKSFWIEAAKYAKNDKSSLMYRKKKWDEFTREVQNSFKLLVKQNKDENKDENFYSSPYFSSISNSNANLNANLAVSSSKPLQNSNNESKSSFEDENNKNDQNDDDVYSDNLMIGNQPKNMNNDIDEKYNGLMKNQVDFILRYKAVAMSGKEVNSSTFWTVIEPFQAVDFTHTEFCILVEILRSQLGVTKSEIHSYLDDKGFPTLFYHLASTSPDFQPISEDSDFNDKMAKKKKKKLIEENKSLVFDVMQKRQKLLEKSPTHQ